jgi:cell division septation protein DedD
MSARLGDVRDEDRLPWLETAEEEHAPRGSAGRILLIALVLVAVLLAVAGGYWWLRNRQVVTGNGALIQAPPGDYKVKPDEPGGMKVEGEGDTVFSTSQGAASNASINVGALPEAPVQGKAAPKPAASTPATKSATLDIPSASGAAKPGAAAPARPSLPATGGGAGSLIQLGAFPSEGGANVEWARLSKRFAYLAPLGKSVERAERDGKAFWRLRVNTGSNSQARELCGRLRVAGENCYVAN